MILNLMGGEHSMSMRSAHHFLSKGLFLGVLTLLTAALGGCGTNFAATAGNGQDTQAQKSLPSQTGGADDSSGNSNGAASEPTAMRTVNQKPRPMLFVRRGNHVTIQMYTEETTVNVAPGTPFHAWTFDGTVPGPVLLLRQGDRVSLTLHNLDPLMAHSIDLHAALLAPNLNFVDVPPGRSRTIHFVASVPGVFLYHCESAPMLQHIAMGMYGAVVVTQKAMPAPRAVVVQSEFYLPPTYDNMLNGQPSYVVFNGQVDRMVSHPLRATVGRPLTIAFVNAGPNESSAFHVVGSTLRTVDLSGNPADALHDVQTVDVPPGDGILATLTFAQPGVYPFVSHDMRQFARGAMGHIVVTRLQTGARK